MQRATISVMRRWQLLRKATPAGHVTNASNSNSGKGSGIGSRNDSESGKNRAPLRAVAEVEGQCCPVELRITYAVVESSLMLICSKQCFAYSRATHEFGS